MAEASLYIERRGAIAHLVLNRPDKRNALTLDMWKRLTRLTAELEAAEDVKVVVVRGVDATVFAAGADIDEFGTVYATPESSWEYTVTLAEAQARLARLSKPTIAMIQGPCIGAGCGIALCCDLRFADPTARFGIPPARLGLMYSLADTKRLVDAVGAARAKDLLYTAKIIDAEEAARIGLVDRLVAAEEIAAETLAYAEQICSVSRFTTKAAKKVIAMIQAGESDDNEETRQMFMDAFQGEDFREGRAAFLEKRKPEFK